MVVVITSQQPSPPKEMSIVPKWLSTSLSKKQNVIPISIPMEYMVSKYLGRTSNSKKLKTEAMIDVDDQTGHWVVEESQPPMDKDVETVTEKDFFIEKVDLGVASQAVDAKHLETSTKRILTRTSNDEKDKNEMKQIIMKMAHYINAIQDPNPQPLSSVPLSFDSKSQMNHKFLDRVQRSRMVVDIFSAWLESISHEGTSYISNMIKVFVSAKSVGKELETKIITQEKEKIKWVFVLKQMRDTQRYGVMNFLVEKRVHGLDDNVLFVCK